MPSLSGAVLFAFIAATYLLSFADRNPWLASVAFAGFAWFVIALFLTTRNFRRLELKSDGSIINHDGESRQGLRLDGVEIPEIPPYGCVRVALSPQKLRYRVSTFTPTGLFYSWTFQKTKRTESSDLGESEPYRVGSPWARVDWKLWFRRGRFQATRVDPGFRLRPAEEPRPEPARARSRPSLARASDASVWAFALSFLLLLALASLSVHFAPLWTGVIFFVWIALTSPGFFRPEKFRYWGRLNFFFCWITLVLVIVAGKQFVAPWMISTSTIAILFIPFALHIKISGATNLLKRFKAMLAIAVLTLLFMYSARTFIADRFQSRHFYYYGGGEAGNDFSWAPSLSSASLRTADRFLARGQGIFWVDFSRDLQLLYRWKLPYWRESTYVFTRNGLNWSSKMLAADSGIPISVNLFMPGRDPLQLQREAPTRAAAPIVTAYDAPSPHLIYVYSDRIHQLVDQLQLDRQKPLAAAEKVIEWMRSEKFRYSLRPGRVNDADDFLFRKKVGLCQHYAGALAFILLAAQIPARVVAGYQGGEVDASDETLLMRDIDAHAWVEVWNAPAKAWVLLDPTSALFPNEYRLDHGGRWTRGLTRLIVVLQSRWEKLQARASVIGFCALFFFLALALYLVWLRSRTAGIEKDSWISAPEVRAWEQKMRQRFGRARKYHEGLSAYYARVSTVSADEELEKEMARLVDALYRQRDADLFRNPDAPVG